MWASLITGNATICQRGWVKEKNKCYRITNNAVTWYQARGSCSDVSASLVNINDLTEQSFVLQMRPLFSNRSYWIGLFKQVSVWCYRLLNSVLSIVVMVVCNSGRI